MEELVFLDLEKITLYGWERRKSDLVIDAIIRGIEAGDDFPPVDVIKVDDKTYNLVKWSSITSLIIDGGHNRAVGHYIQRKPLKCRIINPIEHLDTKICVINIKDIAIGDDGINGDFYVERKQFWGNYR